jgi:hypothetical protein
VPVRVDHRVAGVVPAAVADDEIGVIGEVVDHPTLALVAPLGADHGDDGHGGATATSVREGTAMVAQGSAWMPFERGPDGLSGQRAIDVPAVRDTLELVLAHVLER